MPSSPVAVNVYVAALKENDPSHEAEKPSAFTPGAGLPVPQSWFTAASHWSTTGDPDNVMLLKYFASNWPEQVPPPPPPPVEVACQLT